LQRRYDVFNTTKQNQMAVKKILSVNAIEKGGVIFSIEGLEVSNDR